MNTKFQIIIPMSGFGERFRKAGYLLPKPLIEIDGKPIIAYVIYMFPGEHDFIFVCNQEHLDNPQYKMKEILQEHCPTGRIIGIPSHKLGPIHAIQQIEHLLDMTRPVVVNYCDFTCYWNWENFKKFVVESGCIGAIPAYKGFHPHTLGRTNYAYILENEDRVLDIQEKKPYTNNRMQEYASSGTYYFVSGKVMSDAFNEVVKDDLNVGGEYYVSLAYKPLLKAKKFISVYPLEYFMQWGTPEDVAEYLEWSATFRSLMSPINAFGNFREGSVIIPMAGLGQRFTDEGYKTPKPLIPVSGSPMVVQALSDLPPSIFQSFILREDMPGFMEIKKLLGEIYPSSIITSVPGVTEGQACTSLVGLDALDKASQSELSPITIGACDNGSLYNVDALERMMSDESIDVIVWGVRGHPNAVRNPQMFGWIEEMDGNVKSISVKKPLGSPQNDPIVIGTFTFRRASDIKIAIGKLVDRNGRVNGEFYLDSSINDAIEMGLNCRLFEVDHFISWGTPNDLRTYEYWQACFHKWDQHPYRLENDSRITLADVADTQKGFPLSGTELVGNES
jgi:NDP-sugar pyrophosphorylase family protein